jgi:hypothetical protein
MSINLKTKLVKSNFTLLNVQKDAVSLIDHIMEELKDIDLTQMKLDPAFIQFICLKIENQCQSSNGEKPNKKDIFITIIKKLFPEITQSEIDTAVKIVDFLVKNVLIKKVPLSKIFKYYIKKKFSIQ